MINEAIDSTQKNGLNGILHKLDIEKANDNVNWTYLLEIFDKMGFFKKNDWLDQLVHFYSEFSNVG